MNVVHVTTQDQMADLIRRIFFREDGEFSEMGEPTHEFDEICHYLDIRVEDMLPPGIVDGSDEYYDVLDGIEYDDLRKFVLVDRKVPLLQDFTPGIFIWHMEDGWDRMGDSSIRLIQFTPDADTTYESYCVWHAENQKEYEEIIARQEVYAQMQARHKAGLDFE